ncbi:VPLPA-CTERM sorting domain-containing protein [Rhodovulum sp. DZ06]|uniref:VPLPA-CTERM sorting domain-containing protein n=1 Tax=Rhodovulum sp. DZ06 TaxID=3425126 RepID=UPI003D352CC1
MHRSLCAAALAALLATPAAAVPVQWSGNGHWYEYIDQVTLFENARGFALASTCTTCGGVPLSGYLATVTSAEENAFLLTLNGDGFLGGSDAATEGVWTWLDGPEAGDVFWNGGTGGSSPTYASWNSNEPNNLGDEDVIHINGGNWNDLQSIATRGYFVEYSAEGVSDVPLPAAAPLMLLGLAGLGVAARRKG